MLALLLSLVFQTADLAADARLAKPADIPAVATELTDLVKQIEQRTSVPLSVGPLVESRCLVIVPGGKPYAAILHKLAAFMTATWEKTGEGYRLTRTDAQNKQVQADHRRALLRRTDAARSAIHAMRSILDKESVAGIEGKAKPWRDMGRSLWTSSEAGAVVNQWLNDTGRFYSLLSSPELRAATRAASHLADEDWITLAAGESITLSTATGRLDKGDRAQAADWLRQTAEFRHLAAGDSSLLNRLRLPGEATGRLLPRRGVADPEKLLAAENARDLTIQLSLNDRCELIASATVLDGQGIGVITGATALNLPASRPAAPELDYRSDSALTGKVSWPKTLSDLDPSDETVTGYARAAITAAGNTFVSPEDAVFSKGVAELAAQTKLSLIAEVPSDAFQYSPTRATLAGAAMNDFARQGIVWKHEGDWLIASPIAAEVSRNRHIPHAVTRRVAEIGMKEAGYTLDQLGEAASAVPAALWPVVATYAGFYHAPGTVFPQGDLDSWTICRLYAALSAEQRKSLANARAVNLSGLTGNAAAAVSALGGIGGEASITVATTPVAIQRNALTDGSVYEWTLVDEETLKELKKDPRFLESVYSRDPAKAHRYVRGDQVSVRVVVKGEDGVQRPHSMTFLRPDPKTEFTP